MRRRATDQTSSRQAPPPNELPTAGRRAGSHCRALKIRRGDRAPHRAEYSRRPHFSLSLRSARPLASGAQAEVSASPVAVSVFGDAGTSGSGHATPTYLGELRQLGDSGCLPAVGAAGARQPPRAQRVGEWRAPTCCSARRRRNGAPRRGSLGAHRPVPLHLWRATAAALRTDHLPPGVLAPARGCTAPWRPYSVLRAGRLSQPGNPRWTGTVLRRFSMGKCRVAQRGEKAAQCRLARAAPFSSLRGSRLLSAVPSWYGGRRRETRFRLLSGCRGLANFSILCSSRASCFPHRYTINVFPHIFANSLSSEQILHCNYQQPRYQRTNVRGCAEASFRPSSRHGHKASGIQLHVFFWSYVGSATPTSSRTWSVTTSAPARSIPERFGHGPLKCL
jgi:hypothetical protein